VIRRPLFLLLIGLLACGDDPPPEKDPFFPADYASTYQEVRNCRRSGDHDLNMIRIVADPTSAQIYRDRNAQFPVGAIVIKEEYDMGDVDCSDEIFQFTVMQKLAGGSNADTIDWKWQRVGADRKVKSEDEFRCINCHKLCGEAPEGYEGTCAAP
jgi:hypothetical protein